jgi:hypothetical protein
MIRCDELKATSVNMKFSLERQKGLVEFMTKAMIENLFLVPNKE